MDEIMITPDELSDLIGLVYDSAFEAQQWKSLIDRIAQLFPGIGAIVYGIDGEMMLPEYASTDLPQFIVEPVRMDLGLIDNVLPHEAWRALPNGFVSRTKKFMDEATFVQSGLYRKLLNPAGFRHVIHIKLDARGQRSAVIGFAIPNDPVTETRIHDALFKTLKLLSPHAVRALQLARALTLAKRSAQVCSGFLDGIILPMLVADAHGQFLFGNGAGRRVLERGTPLSVEAGGRLVLDDPEDSRQLRRKIADIDRDLTPGGMRIITDPAPISLSITPFRASMRDASAIDRHLLNEERMFAIFIGQTDVDAISTALLEDVFDLTSREAEVCKGLMLGASASDLADVSGRSLKTIRNQIQIIYEKVGVSSNVALIDALSVFRTVGTMFEDGGGRDNPKPLSLPFAQ
ncbi:helix-turn-helix transcriptional regulator [Roseivivax lentus]|nr:LuxR C-terminal-related transcriptional regulator [Roseivivax lentus]